MSGAASSSEDEYEVCSEFDLHEACESNDTETVKKHLFIDVSDQDTIEFQKERVRQALRLKDEMQCTPLHTALIAGSTDVISLLIAADAIPHSGSLRCNGVPTLHLLLRLGALESHRPLVSKFFPAFTISDYAAKDDFGNTLFHLAAQNNLTDVLSSLLHVDTIDDFLVLKNREGLMPIHLAVKHHASDALRLLLKNSVESYQTTLGHTPAHIAVLYRNSEALALFPETAVTDLQGNSVASLMESTNFKGTVNDIDTTLVYHPEALEHIPNARLIRGGPDPPPENPERIDTLVKAGMGILHSTEFTSKVAWKTTNIPLAPMGDILRVHDYNYVKKIINLSGSCDSEKVVELDSDTALSAQSYSAARRAVGAVCTAIDSVIKGETRNAFAVVRPPGHHAGPVGKVTCSNDPEGSHGFCLFNNVAVGAAYARCVHRHNNIKKIAILDFDVHHGNGTEEIVNFLSPKTESVLYQTPYGSGSTNVEKYKPWLNDRDSENVFFASVHGYGKKDPGTSESQFSDYWFYPGSGDATDNANPLVINVGLGYYENRVQARRSWRRSFRDNVLRKLANFEPDLILISAGFDAHRKEDVNWGYASLLEHDYEWLTRHIVSIANRYCDGRVVSVLEGGYNFHGRIASPFARSVAAHVRGLCSKSRATWNDEDINWERDYEISLEKAAEEKKLRAREEAMAAMETLKVKPENNIIAVENDDTLPSSGRSKRRKTNVDYVALAAKMDAEKH